MERKVDSFGPVDTSRQASKVQLNKELRVATSGEICWRYLRLTASACLQGQRKQYYQGNSTLIFQRRFSPVERMHI